MVSHYLKIALRNLWKYRTQSLISLVGLAVGFVCFALATLWIRYEMTYDTFHKDSDRIYLVERNYESFFSTFFFSYLLAPYLEETFPEIEEACSVQFWDVNIKKEGVEYEGKTLFVDTISSRFFDIQAIEGNKDYMIPHSKSIAVTENFGRKVAPDGDIIGSKVLIQGKEYTVCAVVKGWKGHSIMPFDMISPLEPNNDWGWINFFTFVKVKNSANINHLQQKLSDHKIEGNNTNVEGLKLTSISQVRYKTKNMNEGVKFEYIFLFVLIGILVVINVFINYFTLFSNRFSMREKELGVRKVCGANPVSLFLLLFTEFVVTLLLALLLGLLLIALISSPFFELSGINPTYYSVYWESLLFILLMIAISSLFFYLFLQILFKRSLSDVIKRRGRKRQNLSLVLQLIISIGFVFVTSVIVKQVYYLYNSDLGFEYKNTALLGVWPMVMPIEELETKLKETPGVEDVIFSDFSLIPRNYKIGNSHLEWEGKPKDSEEHEVVEILGITPDYLHFYNVKLVAGDLISEKDAPDATLITESALKIFGWRDPVGKTIVYGGESYKVKGVLKDIHYTSPVIPPVPMIFLNKKITDNATILLKYDQGSREEIESTFNAWLNREYPQAFLYLRHANDVFDEYMKSENALLQIIGFSSLVCLIVSLFGFYSIISLICENRRRELAIRKINGVTVQTILFSFFREYFVLLLISSLIAFAIAGIITRRWIEHYVLQTDIPVWLYIAILVAFAVMIIVSVGWQIYKVSRENPVEVLKRD